MTKGKMKQWITVGVLTLAMLLTPLMEVRAAQTFREIKISGDYDSVYGFSEGLAVVVNKDRKFGYIDKNGKEVIVCQYDWAYDFSEGLAAVEKDGKWGYINQSGEEVIACKYDSCCYSFSEGLAPVKKDSKWGYINQSGEEVIAFIYDEAWEFTESLATVGKDGKRGFINQSGEEVIAFKYEGEYSTGAFSEGLVAVMKDGKWGYINQFGEEVIACKYDDAYEFSEGYAVVMKYGKYGYINQSGEEVIGCKYDRAFEFSDGLAAVMKDGKWGWINKSDEEVIAFKYDDTYNTGAFAEGLVVASNKDGWDNKYGYINKSGEEVIACKYDRATSFSDGVAVVKDPDKGWLILTMETQIPVTSIPVTSTVNNSAYGTVSCPSTVGIGETVTYQAQPKKGYKFDGWYRNGELVSEQNPYSFVATADNTNLQAIFSLEQSVKEQIPVTSSVNNSVYGKVSCPSTVAVGEKVTYKAQPNVGYKFDGWYRNGALVSSLNPYSFVASADNTNLQAVFSWDKSLNDDKLAKLAESSELPILLLEGHANKNQINLKWTNAGKNVYYEVYQSVCDGKANFTKVGTTQKNNFTIKNLNKKRAYKFFVAAYKKSGNDKSYIAKAISAHIALPGYAQTNVKSLSLKSSSVTIKEGKTAKIKATAIGENPKKKMVNHVAAFRYETSNKAIATVNKKGVIKGQKKGSCTIYVIANNGVHKSVKVQVK